MNRTIFIFRYVVLMFFSLACSANHSGGQQIETVSDTSATSPVTLKNSIANNKTRQIEVGAFTVSIPAGWRNLTETDLNALRAEYLAQSEEIYRQYSGGDDPARSVDLSAFHIGGQAGTFVIVSFTVPPQADLIPLLKSQAADKGAWGIREGYIRKYLGLVPLETDEFSGFYTKMIGNKGNVQISAGLEHQKLKNTIIQLSLLCPKAWDEAKATDELTAILSTVSLKSR